jgi:predicted  nucleic acid-binding Zn-ribbon protein
MIEWKDIDIQDFGGDSALMQEVDDKIKMTGQKDVKPGDILQSAAGHGIPGVEKLEKEIKDLTGEKEKLQKQIKDLESKEAKAPEEDKDENKVQEIKKLKNDIDTFEAQKQELQTRIKELQAA